MLSLDYRASDRRALLFWSSDDQSQPWVDIVKRLLSDASEEASQEGAFVISLPWWNFVAIRGQFQNICLGYSLKPGSGLQVSETARELLKGSKRASEAYAAAVNALQVDEQVLKSRLREIGFGRELTEKQSRNVRRLASLPAAATFSVPGAGKTTEALATFFFRAVADERLLVIAPKNAFAAWDEQISECMPHLNASFERLRGGREKIARQLQLSPRFMLITYQQMARVSDVIASYCARSPSYVFLDESHRIKSGVSKQTARAVLGLSHLPVGKLIMSGTPMPQSPQDLIPQFAFLYPEVPADVERVVELLKPVYVRTNKAELGLPPVTRKYIPLQMAPMQRELYRLMKSEVAREATFALTSPGKVAFRALGRSVAKLLQFVSNPALVSADINFAHPDLLAAVLSEGDGPKLKYVLRRARQLASEGKKVLIWSSFKRNVEYISERLSDLGAVYIHGDVDAGDEDDDESREGKIRLFHDDPDVMVMVANPAAASEGVSLHRICHHALYLDRTFNAAHYLQSEDRIHRFGLPPEQDTNIEIVQCVDSVDETVRERLEFKISEMAEALEDSSLRPIALDPDDSEDLEEYSTGLSQDDIAALLRGLADR